MNSGANKNNQQLIQDIISSNTQLRGNNVPTLSYIVDKISVLDSTVALVDLVPEISVIIADSSFLSITASAASVSAIALFPVGIMINIINNMEAGLRLYGMRAIAYTITAWAYGDNIPTRSPTILRNITTGIIQAKAWDIQKRDKAWKSASDAALYNLNNKIKSKNIKKETMQLIFKALSNNDKQKLNVAILTGFENQLSPIEKITWKSNYKIQYPF